MQVRLYCDGACSGNPGPGGWAIVCNTDQECQTYGRYETKTTNNRMELTAVLESLKIITNWKETNAFEIYSDSAYVVNAITKGWLANWKINGWWTTMGSIVKNNDLWAKVVDELKTIEDNGLSVQITKIKGHSGNTFNEMVDKLAKEQSIKAQLARKAK